MIKRNIVPLTLALIFALIMLVGWGNYLLLKKDAEKVGTVVQSIQDSVAAGNWEEAGSYFKEALKIWNKPANTGRCSSNHQEMDRIEECMNRKKRLVIALCPKPN